MTRIMGDSSTFGDVPAHVDIVAAYASGHLGVATPEQMEAKYPNAMYGHCLIDVSGGRPDVHVRDWETGDKAGDLKTWVGNHNDHTGTRDAVIYCNVSTIPEVREKTGMFVLGYDYWLFVATLDGSLYKATGVIACQNKGSKLTGGHWDSSEVYDDRFWQATGVSKTGNGYASNCVALQTAIHITADGVWGVITDGTLKIISDAALGIFQSGISKAQGIVGAKVDGVWGPNSKTALKDTVAGVQRALTGMGFDTKGVDGVWGANTNVAFMAARTHYYH